MLSSVASATWLGISSSNNSSLANGGPPTKNEIGVNRSVLSEKVVLQRTLNSITYRTNSIYWDR